MEDMLITYTCLCDAKAERAKGDPFKMFKKLHLSDNYSVITKQTFSDVSVIQ